MHVGFHRLLLPANLCYRRYITISLLEIVTREL